MNAGWKNNWMVDYLCFKKLHHQLHFLFPGLNKLEKVSHSGVTMGSVVSTPISYNYCHLISEYQYFVTNSGIIWSSLNISFVDRTVEVTFQLI